MFHFKLTPRLGAVLAIAAGAIAALAPVAHATGNV
jgi:hypothetical protein